MVITDNLDKNFSYLPKPKSKKLLPTFSQVEQHVEVVYGVVTLFSWLMNVNFYFPQRTSSSFGFYGFVLACNLFRKKSALFLKYFI